VFLHPPADVASITGVEHVLSGIRHNIDAISFLREDNYKGILIFKEV
jgi:hypothetical protein